MAFCTFIHFAAIVTHAIEIFEAADAAPFDVLWHLVEALTLEEKSKSQTDEDKIVTHR